MRRILAALGLLVLMETASAAEGPSNPLAPVGRSLEALLNPPVEEGDRAVIAAGLAAMCQRAADVVPTLSPRENEWLDSELHSSRERLLSAAASVEFSKRYVGSVLRNCSHSAGEILKLKSVENENFKRMSEELLWAKLVATLSREDIRSHIDNLSNHGVVPIGDDDMSGPRLAPMIARLILDGIVIPLMSEKFNKQTGN